MPDQLPAHSEESIHRALATVSTGQGIPQIIPQSMDEVWRFATVLAKSKILPKGIETPEQVTVQILMGFDLGLKPIQAVQNITVINGRPSIGGDLALALLFQSGLLEEHDERIEGEGNDRSAVCRVKRKGMAAIERRFSVADAIQAALWDDRPKVRKSWWNKKEDRREYARDETPNEAPWFRYQNRMLTMRARGFAFRDRFSDVLKGMHLEEEFIGHEGEDQPRDRIAPPSPPQAVLEAAGERPGRAPPREQVEEAEVVENSTVAAPPRPTEEHHPVAGETAPAEPEDEVEDAEALLEEARELFASCGSSASVDEAHDMLQERVERSLDRGQREQYADLHMAALARFEAKADEPTTDATNPDQGSQAEAYRERTRAMLRRPDVTPKEIFETWTAEAAERAAVMVQEDRAALMAEVQARISELESGGPDSTKAAAPDDSATASEAPSAAAVGAPSDDVDDARFVQLFVDHIFTLPGRREIDEFVSDTLKRRNRIGAEDEAAKDTFRDAIRRARGKFGAQG